MSADEDTELRDLVAQTLEANGVLGKIRAQLRSSVFLALEEQESLQSKTPFANAELKKFVTTKEGRIITGLVREFLEHFNMEFTLAVYDPESNVGDQYEGRSSLARELDILESEDTSKLPLLAQLVKKSSGEDGRRKRLPSGAEGSSESVSSSSTPQEPALESGDKVEEAHIQGASGSNLVENKNIKNLHSGNGPDPFQYNDADDDAFFDDPIPSNNNTKSFSSGEKQKEDLKLDAKTEKPSSGGGLSSLAGLPSLAPSDSKKTSKGFDLDKDIKAIDKNLTDLGFDVPEDDYDDDFESSNVSPFGVTPRSARSEHNVKSIEEELEEEIEEDLSVAEDLLRSDNSGMDDLTTDRTVSPDHQSNAIDYMEDVMVP